MKSEMGPLGTSSSHTPPSEHTRGQPHPSARKESGVPRVHCVGGMDRYEPTSVRLLIYIVLAAATAAVYWPVHRFAFVHFDDDIYVYENPQVSAGLTRASIGWAWRSPQIANYHPLTLMSLQLDATLFGLHAGPYH